MAVIWTEQAETKGASNWQYVESSRDGQHLVAIANSAFGVWLSHDAGDTWTQCRTGGMPTGIGWISACISDDGKEIVALSSAAGGGYRSADGGLTWTVLTLPQKAYKAAACSADGSTIVVAGNGDFVYVSNDHGATWTKKVPQGGTATAYWQSAAVSADGSTIYVGTGNTSGQNFLCKSADSGATFTVAQGSNSSNETVFSLDCSDDGLTVVAARGSQRVLISTDGCATLTHFTIPTTGWPNRNMKWAKCSRDGQTIVVAPDRSAYLVARSLDRGATWTLEAIPGGIGDFASLAMSGDGKRLTIPRYQQAIWTAIDALPPQSWLAMYIGDVPVRSLYKGSTLVWQAP